jgi:adenylate cyclase
MKRIVGCVGGGLLAIGVGCALLFVGKELTHLSYDLPFVTRSPLVRPEIVIVYIDTASRMKFQSPSTGLDRRAHVELLQRLTQDGARMVFYDIVFRDEVPGVDQDFADAIRKHGNVVLGYYESVASRETQLGLGIVRESVQANRTLREAAQHYGLLMVAHPDAKSVVRRLFTGDADSEAGVWVAARALDTNNILGERLKERWLNFYAYPPAFDSVSFATALTDEARPDFFRNKIVFIGAHPEDMASLTEREKFATSWGRYAYATGVEFLATSLGNLIQGNWLRRVPRDTQLAVIIGLGLLMGVSLSLLRPWTAAGVAVGAVAVITASAFYLQYEKNLWWSWMIPVAAQTPLALVWSIGYQYAVASRREAQMQKAFSSYLSPHLVKRIAASDFELTLGGKEVEATILFTDLEGFTALAESLPPHEVSRILVSYFERITTHILKHEGTIIKYVGDAVMAVWGAPLADAHQAERAVLAARGIIHSSQMAFSGRHLRTRIGINSGKALAGNLGSSFRFDYSVIGATTNLASRLEALNKLLGTDVLVSGETAKQLPATVTKRYLGRFLLRGTMQPTSVYEVPERLSPLTAIFEDAVQACESGDVDRAKALFGKIGDHDGPTRFYLKYLKSLESVPSPFVIKLSD